MPTGGNLPCKQFDFAAVAAALNIKEGAAAKRYSRLRKAINDAGLSGGSTTTTTATTSATDNDGLADQSTATEGLTTTAATTTKKRKNTTEEGGNKKGKKKVKATKESEEATEPKIKVEEGLEDDLNGDEFEGKD